MSSQPNSSVYSEKKIAAYESLFKESSFAKPQEVYLTITVAHLFGQAYIMEQQGTKEGDPVYSRFVCPLEEITKVYINDNVKASPLFIQCDTDVKGVIHRKRIIIPCLENVAAIVEQIKEVQSLHMEKFEAAQEKEKQRKREQLEAARMKEQNSSIANVSSVSTADIKVAEPVKAATKTEPIAKPQAAVKEQPAVKASAEKTSAPKINVTKPVETPKLNDTKSAVKDKSLASFNDDVAASLKALENFGNSLKSTKSSVNTADDKAQPLPELKPIPEIKNIPVAEAKPVAEVKPAPVEETKPVAEVKPAPVEEAKPVAEVKPAPVEETKPVAEVKPAPVEETKPIAEVKPAPVEEAKPVAEVKPAPVEEAKPVAEVKPAPAPKMVNPNGTAMALEDFQAAVMKLKSMKDSGVLSDEEFAAEKKKLLANLY